jgi:hypothetical protein
VGHPALSKKRKTNARVRPYARKVFLVPETEQRDMCGIQGVKLGIQVLTSTSVEIAG